MDETTKELLPYLIPIAIIDIAFLVIALRDLIRRKNVRGGNKIIWGLVIVLIGFFGPLAYFGYGRQEDTVDSD